ncbi:E3 ubiquitin-protein ligase UPL5 isoform X1 [Musa acuminata AAA Group]|uniref:E3 ubiquitin-protein ligase UPL5 isoform X1 n=1 Tax=Musa acuminata AAA Group TaxID=214697 RepID=UPI0031D90D10
MESSGSSPTAAAFPRFLSSQHHHERKNDDYADQDHSFPLLKMVKPWPPLSFYPLSFSPATVDDADEDLQFFVRLLTGESLVIHARPTDTVDSVIERIEKVTGIPCYQQRLIYRGRQLQGDSTLLDSAVKKDTTLQLTCGLRSTDQPTSWRVVSDLISSIWFLNTAAPGTHSSVRQWNTVDLLVKRFLANTLLDSDADKKKISARLHVFILAGAPSELVKLYLSPVLENRVIAAVAIRIFLTPDPDFLPAQMHLHCAPIVLTFCKMLAASVGRKDRLYIGCRSTLARLLKSGPPYYVHWTSVHLLTDLQVFIAELVGLADVALSSHTMYISYVVITDLSNFLFAVHHVTQDLKGTDGFISKNYFDPGYPMYENIIGVLHDLFFKLLNKVGQCLMRAEDIMDLRGLARCEVQLKTWSQLLEVLAVVKVFSDLFEGAGQFLHSLLLKQRRMLNVLLRRAKRDHKLRWFLKYKDVTDFAARRNLVLMMLPVAKEEDELHEMLIDRSQLLPESFEYIGQVDATELHGGLFMEFKDEEATGPGVLREWFCLLCKAIFNPDSPLFLPCPHDHRRFFPNPASAVDPLHLEYFNFVGRVIALALMHKVQVGVVFDRVFFLQLAGRSITLEDVCDADPVLYRGCKQILEMDEAFLDSDALGLTFTRDIEMLGSKTTVELCPGGKNITVDSRNREEYVNLMIKHCFVTSISEQIARFAQGFSDFLSNSEDLQFFFNSLDLEDFDRMLGGSNNVISVREWKEHTDYDGYKSRDRQICWFWKIVEGMPEEQRRLLLFFWTSIRYLPVDGFRGLSSRLYIYRCSDSKERLPTSHTCFFSLNLPAYRTKSIMRDRLHLITREHVSCSFGTS